MPSGFQNTLSVTFISVFMFATLNGCSSSNHRAAEVSAVGINADPSGRAVPARQDRDTPASKDSSFLLLGEFSSRQQAHDLLRRILDIGLNAYVERLDDIYTIKSGPYTDTDRTLRLKSKVDQRLNIESRVVFE